VVDPLTLLAVANAAVAAVKKGCQLYKDIKDAAGDVHEVLEDLKTQYHKIVDPTPQQKMQYNAEVQRVQEIAKADPNDTFTEIGNQLGILMDAYDALSKALLQEELSGKKVYKGEERCGVSLRLCGSVLSPSRKQHMSKNLSRIRLQNGDGQV
jgi:hypothetical protein